MNLEDKRSANLYATEKAKTLKIQKSIWMGYYEWLLEQIPEEEREAFMKTLDKIVSVQ